MNGVHFFFICRHGFGNDGFQRAVEFRAFGGSGNRSSEVFFRHRDRAADEISEVVRQVGIVSLDNGLVSDRSVRGERRLGKNVVSDRVNAERLDKIVRIDNVAFRFRHFIFAE